MADEEEIGSEGYHDGALNDNGIFVFMDEVTAITIKPVISWILYENFVAKERKKELLLMVCSEGGDLGAAFALIDVMLSSSIPIKTVGLGQISSCGLLIFMTGSKGRRILTPNTSILSHQFSWGSAGKSHELFATIREFELTHQRMVDHYVRCTGLDLDTIKTKLLPPQDIWLSATEAMELHVCDAIGGSAPTTESTKPQRKTKQ